MSLHWTTLWPHLSCFEGMLDFLASRKLLGNKKHSMLLLWMYRLGSCRSLALLHFQRSFWLRSWVPEGLWLMDGWTKNQKTMNFVRYCKCFLLSILLSNRATNLARGCDKHLCRGCNVNATRSMSTCIYTIMMYLDMYIYIYTCSPPPPHKDLPFPAF